MQLEKESTVIYQLVINNKQQGMLTHFIHVDSVIHVQLLQANAWYCCEADINKNCMQNVYQTGIMYKSDVNFSCNWVKIAS